MRKIQTVKQDKPRSVRDIFNFGIPLRFSWARAAVSLTIVVIIASMLAGTTAYAARGSLPGEWLYPVKLGTESARLLLAGDSPARAELNLIFARERLSELFMLADKDLESSLSAVQGYRDNLGAATRQIRAVTDTPALTGLLIGALEQIQDQLVFCDSIIENNPAYTGPGVQASTAAANQQAEFTQMLAEQDIIKAVEINFAAMRNRLQRARNMADAGKFQFMEMALLQYQLFNQQGERLLLNSRDSGIHTEEIEQLSLQEISDDLATLENLSQKAPGEYAESIEASRKITLEYQTQAQHGHQGQDGEIAPGDQTGQQGPNTDSPNPSEPGGGADQPGSTDGKPASGEPGNEPLEPPPAEPGGSGGNPDPGPPITTVSPGTGQPAVPGEPGTGTPGVGGPTGDEGPGTGGSDSGPGGSGGYDDPGSGTGGTGNDEPGPPKNQH